MFLIQWIALLDSIPDLELISYLPEFLGGLIGYLSDPNTDVRVAAAGVVAEFLRQVRIVTLALGIQPTVPGGAAQEDNGRDPIAPLYGCRLDFSRMVTILLPHIPSTDQETAATALRWINEFILIAKMVMIPFTPPLLASILPSLSHPVPDIRGIAADANSNLYKLVRDYDRGLKAELDMTSTVAELLKSLNGEEETRIMALEWLLMLHSQLSDSVLQSNPTLFSALLKILTDHSEEVVKRSLQLLSQISEITSSYFPKFMSSLLQLFSSDRKLLESRGTLIIRHLSSSLNPRRIFLSMATLLQTETSLEFASLMIQHLNHILLTSPECSSLRKALKTLSKITPPAQTKESWNLFLTLYLAWSHNPVSTLSLCLLTKSYPHASRLLSTFPDLEISLSMLIQLDKLVQLIESPVFTSLRLDLCKPRESPELLQCLYGVLMLLPQSSAFATLRNRLGCLNGLVLMGVGEELGRAAGTKDDTGRTSNTRRQREASKSTYSSSSSIASGLRTSSGDPTSTKIKDPDTDPNNTSRDEEEDKTSPSTVVRDWDMLLDHFLAVQLLHETHETGKKRDERRQKDERRNLQQQQQQQQRDKERRK